MPIVIPPNYCQHIVRMESDVFTDGYALFTIGQFMGAEAIDTVADQFSAALADSGLDLSLSELVTISTVTTISDVSSTVTTLDMAGTSTASFPPVNSAALVKKVTTTRGRRGQGRFFLPMCIPEDKVTASGLIDTVDRVNLENRLDLFRSEATAASLPFVILQGDNPGDKTPPITPPPTVLSLRVDERLGSQRRRMRR